MDEETGILEVAGNVVVESDRVVETVVDDQDIDEVEQVDGTGLQERELLLASFLSLPLLICRWRRRARCSTGTLQGSRPNPAPWTTS